MTLKFNYYYCIISVVILATEILIAPKLNSGFIRHTFGDFLAVILIYTCIKTCFKISLRKSTLIALTIAFCVEFLQLIQFLEFLHLNHNKWALLLFGNTFQFTDLIAYTTGIIVTLIIELNLNNDSNEITH